MRRSPAVLDANTPELWHTDGTPSAKDGKSVFARLARGSATETAEMVRKDGVEGIAQPIAGAGAPVVKKTGAAAGKTVADGDKVKVVNGKRKPHRWRPGTKALQEIRKYQGGVGGGRFRGEAIDVALFFSKACFGRLVREIARQVCNERNIDPRLFQDKSIKALQHASETMLEAYYTGAQGVAVTAGRKTVTRNDLRRFIYSSECPLSSVSARTDPSVDQNRVCWNPNAHKTHIDILDLSKPATS